MANITALRQFTQAWAGFQHYPQRQIPAWAGCVPLSVSPAAGARFIFIFERQLQIQKWRSGFGILYVATRMGLHWRPIFCVFVNVSNTSRISV